MDGDTPYHTLLSKLNRRRQLTAAELRLIAEAEDVAHEGMCAQEEDLLDQELLEEDQDHEEIEAEMEMDPQPSLSAGYV